MEYPMRTRIFVDCSDTDRFSTGAGSDRRTKARNADGQISTVAVRRRKTRDIALYGRVQRSPRTRVQRSPVYTTIRTCRALVISLGRLTSRTGL